MNEIREYIQKTKFIIEKSTEELDKNDFLYILSSIEGMIETEKLLINPPSSEKPELKEGDTWLVKIGGITTLKEFTIGQIKEKTISNQFTTHGFGGLQSIDENWYKISDIEWVERIEE